MTSTDHAVDPVPGEFITRPGPDPHVRTAELRTQCPVHRVDYPSGAEAYVVIGHDAAVRAFTDSRLSKRLDDAPAWFREQTLRNSPVITSNMLLADGSEHRRLRSLIARAFLPRRMEPLRSRVQQIADDLVDALPGSGEVDLLVEFALPLPMLVICEFLGVPAVDRARFEGWGRVLSQSPGERDTEKARERKDVNDDVVTYLSGVLAARRRDLGTDLVSDLLRAADEYGTFTEAELVSTLIFLIIAGHKTTANLIGNGMQALLRHPDQLTLLRSNPGLMPSAVEEFLRYEGSVDRGTLRVAAEDIVLAGVPIPKESFVHLSVAAAGRDPAVIDDPDRFDITRSPNKHITFGYGAHFCAGAPLARLEGQVAFATLLRRLPALELAVPDTELRWLADSSISRGLEQLPVRIIDKLPRAHQQPNTRTSTRKG